MARNSSAIHLVSFIGAMLAALVLGAKTPASASQTEEITILAFGDSLTHGYGLEAGETFPDQLEAALLAEGRNVRVINGGVSGETTAGGLRRIDWALADQPDLVIIELGSNDMLRGLDPGQAKANLSAIISRAKESGAAVILAGMRAARNLATDYVTAFDALYPELAREHAVALYPFFLDGVALDPSLNQPDGIHPNAQGVSVIVAKLLPCVIAELNKLENP